MGKVDDHLNSASAIICLVGAACADTALGGAGSAISGLQTIRSGLRGKLPTLEERVAKDISNALNDPHLRLPGDARLLIPQMIEAGQLTYAEVMAARLSSDKICTAMLGKLTDFEHRQQPMQDAFRRVVAPIIESLLTDHELTPLLQPAFMRAVAESTGEIGEIVQAEAARGARLETMMLQLLAQSGEKQAAIEKGVTEARIVALARQIGAKIDDPDQAFRELEAAVAEAKDARARLSLVSNSDSVVTNLRQGLATLVDAGQLQEAADMAMASLKQLRNAEAERRSRSQAAETEMIDIAIERFSELRDAASVASLLVEQAQVENRAGFDDLRAVFMEWYERGRDKGLNFDLAVSIALADLTHSHATTPDQRGTALNDLGTALLALGQRESGTARLEQAVAAYRAALEEWTRDRVPLDWAMTQMNLGNALLALGQRESGTARLEQAVAAYRAALEERTRDRVPLDWANALGNQGVALLVLADRTRDLAQARQAMDQLRLAEAELREGGHAPWAATFAEAIPVAEALVATLADGKK